MRGPGPPTEQADRATIEVRVHEVAQLFNSLDPSPFAERDLDDDAEAYLVGWAREVDSQGPFRILVHLPAVEADKARQRDLGSAIGHYFAYRAGMLERDLSDLFRTGWRSFAIGVAVLAASIALSQAVRTALPDSGLAQLVAEGIMIFGWVANWRHGRCSCTATTPSMLRGARPERTAVRVLFMPGSRPTPATR